MMNSISAKRVWTSGGWLENAKVTISDGKIEKIESGIPESTCDVSVLIPGMIELHAHGSLGYNSAIPSEEENRAWLRRLASHGTTGVLPTLSSNPADVICGAVDFYSKIKKAPIAGGAKVLGVHLEGPFLNPEKRGGINPLYLRLPTVEHFCELVGENRDTVKLITVAPELCGACELIDHLTECGISVNAGHTNATAEEMRRAIGHGLNGVTHFFNAARPITHRDPGLLTAALLDDGVYLEMVSDLVHLAPEIIHLMVKAAGAKRIAAITDAVKLTGLPDGEYDNDCIVKDGSPRKSNGTLTGGRYLMDGCARALIGIGVDPWDVFCMTSYTPAARIGAKGVGDIAIGYSADLVAMDDSYQIIYTVIDGEKNNSKE